MKSIHYCSESITHIDDLDKILRLKWFGFRFKLTPIDDDYCKITIIFDPRN